MPTPFKMLESEITRLIITAGSTDSIVEKHKLNEKIQKKFSKMLDFPADQMTPEDHAMLRSLETRLASTDFNEKVKKKKKKK